MIAYVVVLAMIAVPLAASAIPPGAGDCTDVNLSKWCDEDPGPSLQDQIDDLEARVAILEGTPPPVTTTTMVPVTTTIQPVTTTTLPVVTTTLPVSGDVDIYPGDSISDAARDNPAGTIFIIKTGNHDVGTRINPRDGQQFLGEPGAVLDGNNTTEQAFRASDNAKDVVVDGLIIENFATIARAGALANGTGGGWTISNNEIRYNGAIGIVFNGPGNKILNNNLHHNEAMGVKGFGSDSLVEDNEIAYNNPNDITVAGWEAGGTKFIQTVNLTIRGNWVHHNHDMGLWSDYENTGTIYEDNLVENNLDIGIFHEISYSAVIRNNIILNNGGRAIKFTSSSDVEIYGNTIVAAAGTSGIFASDSERGSGNQGVFEIRNLWVHDNTITMDTGVTGLRDNKGTGKVWNNNNRFDRNTYIVNSPDPFFWEGNDRYTFPEFQTFGQELNGSIS